MRYVVVAVWLVQACLGLALVRAGRRRTGHGPHRLPRLVIVHVSLVLLALLAWIVFLVRDQVAWGWACFVLLTIALSFGDVMLTRRSVRAAGSAQSGNAYLRAIRDVFTGRMPALVIAHALVSPLVYFVVLGVCIVAT